MSRLIAAHRLVFILGGVVVVIFGVTAGTVSMVSANRHPHPKVISFPISTTPRPQPSPVTTTLPQPPKTTLPVSHPATTSSSTRPYISDPSAPECQPAQLSWSTADYSVSGAGEFIRRQRLTNISSTTCNVEGYPVITNESQSTPHVEITYSVSTWTAGPNVPPIPEHEVTLQPGQAADFFVQYVEQWPGPYVPGPVPGQSYFQLPGWSTRVPMPTKSRWISPYPHPLNGTVGQLSESPLFPSTEYKGLLYWITSGGNGTPPGP